MQRTTYSDLAPCSIARTVDVIGEPWSPLILRDVFVGINRFDQIQADLGVSRKVLSERLGRLVDNGVLERQRYHERPPRDEYVLTEKGRELVDLLMVMVAWGDRWADDGAGPPVLYRHHAVNILGIDEAKGNNRALVQATLDLLRGLGLAASLSDDSARRARILDAWADVLERELELDE